MKLRSSKAACCLGATLVVMMMPVLPKVTDAKPTYEQHESTITDTEVRVASYAANVEDRRHTGTGHAHAQHGDEPEVEDDVEHRREDEEDQRHEAVADGPQQAGAEVIGKHDDDAEVDDDDIAVGVL